MEDERVDGDVLPVDGLPLVEADLVLRVEHAHLAADAAGGQHVRRLAAKLQRRPRQRVEVLPGEEGEEGVQESGV